MGSLDTLFFYVDYLNHLGEVVNMPKAQVTVILGKKDAGKSMGLKRMMGVWNAVGHIVIDINLKGMPHQVDTGMLMPRVANTVINKVSSLVAV